MFIKVSSETYISAEDALCLMTYTRRKTITQLIEAHKQEGTLIDVTFGKKIACVILLKSGQLILSPTNIVTVVGRLNQAQSSYSGGQTKVIQSNGQADQSDKEDPNE